MARNVPASVGQEDRAGLRAGQILGVAGDSVHHRGEVERRRDVAPHFGQRRGLARAALCFGEEARILECDAHAVGERLQQPDVRFAEGVLPLHVANSISPRTWSPASKGTKIADFSICVPGRTRLPYFAISPPCSG